MDDEKALLKQVFDDSSDSEDNSEQKDVGCHSTLDSNYPTWEPVKEIKGLWMCRDFLSPQQQSNILSAIQNDGWFLEASNNQAMRFGDLPLWAFELANSIRELVLCGGCVHEPPNFFGPDRGDVACSLPSPLLWREPFFDQLIVNVYKPGEVRF